MAINFNEISFQNQKKNQENQENHDPQTKKDPSEDMMEPACDLCRIGIRHRHQQQKPRKPKP